MCERNQSGPFDVGLQFEESLRCQKKKTGWAGSTRIFGKKRPGPVPPFFPHFMWDRTPPFFEIVLQSIDRCYTRHLSFIFQVFLRSDVFRLPIWSNVFNPGTPFIWDRKSPRRRRPIWDRTLKSSTLKSDLEKRNRPISEKVGKKGEKGLDVIRGNSGPTLWRAASGGALALEPAIF